MKTGNNSNKLKKKIRKILYISYQQNKITKKVDQVKTKQLNRVIITWWW